MGTLELVSFHYCLYFLGLSKSYPLPTSSYYFHFLHPILYINEMITIYCPVKYLKMIVYIILLYF